MKKWVWKINLSMLVGQYAHTENKDGTCREGRVSSIVMKSFKLNGTDVDLPEAFELNGDPTDLVFIEHLKSVDFM